MNFPPLGPSNYNVPAKTEDTSFASKAVAFCSLPAATAEDKSRSLKAAAGYAALGAAHFTLSFIPGGHLLVTVASGVLSGGGALVGIGSGDKNISGHGRLLAVSSAASLVPFVGSAGYFAAAGRSVIAAMSGH